MPVQDYIAHSEPICKALNLVKVPDMYTCCLELLLQTYE